MGKNKDILEMYMLYPHKYKKADLVKRHLTPRDDDPAGDSKFEQIMIDQGIKNAKEKYNKLHNLKTGIKDQFADKLKNEFQKITKAKAEKLKSKKNQVMSDF